MTQDFDQERETAQGVFDEVVHRIVDPLLDTFATRVEAQNERGFKTVRTQLSSSAVAFQDLQEALTKRDQVLNGALAGLGSALEQESTKLLEMAKVQDKTAAQLSQTTDLVHNDVGTVGAEVEQNTARLTALLHHLEGLSGRVDMMSGQAVAFNTAAESRSAALADQVSTLDKTIAQSSKELEDRSDALEARVTRLTWIAIASILTTTVAAIAIALLLLLR
ncbi:MAG: hypothetical protein WCP28_07230 [Actinomycetes bacterium]